MLLVSVKIQGHGEGKRERVRTRKLYAGLKVVLRENVLCSRCINIVFRSGVFRLTLSRRPPGALGP